MANLKHLEEVVLLPERPYLHTVVRNTLYSLYRESATLEWMQNPDNVERVNLPTMRLTNYNHFGEQLEKCRKILFPSRQDLIGMMLWLLKAATKMWTEGKSLKLFDDEPQWAVAESTPKPTSRTSPGTSSRPKRSRRTQTLPSTGAACNK